MMTRRTDSFVLTLLVAVALMAGCGKGSILPHFGEDGSGLPQALVLADSLMNSRPDSALAVLDGAEEEMAGEPKSVRMRYQLLRHQAMNKAFVPFTSDSLMLDVADYYDRHGTPNERVQAHYLLGCVYRDLKEVPRAIDSFKDAITKADTISADCDFQVLGCVYSQMAILFHQLLLLSYEIEARKMASHYAYMAHDTLNAIYDFKMISGAYILMNKTDSAAIILQNAMQKYEEFGNFEESIRTSVMLIHLYINQSNRLSDAKSLMDRYEEKSNLFDAHHELPPSKRQYYYYKGKYYEDMGRLDSAEYFYRKVYRPQMTPVQNNPMYKGLLRVFRKRHLPDSIAKYSLLYCQANDSSIALKDQQLTAQMAASYDYHFYKEKALLNEKEAYKNWLLSIILLISLSIVIVMGIYAGRRYKLRQEEKRKKLQQEFAKTELLLKAEFAKAKESYEKNLQKLQLLDSAHQGTIKELASELDATTGRSEQYKEKYNRVQQALVQASEKYEIEKAELCAKNEELKARIEELKRHEEVSKNLGLSMAFAGSEVVLRMQQAISSPILNVSEKDWKALEATFRRSYPSLYRDLCTLNESTRSVRVCILTIMKVQSNVQARLLKTSKQTITNTKASINKRLCNEDTAVTLLKNLVTRYDLYVF